MKKQFATFVFFLSIFAISCDTKKLPVRTLQIKTNSGKIVEIEAEIADTAKTRQHGFMERKSIPDGTGMLFVFERDSVQSFWMKNTPTALSIAYIDSNGKIRDIFDMKPYSLADVTSTVSVRYALEVPQGWFSRVGIGVGDVVFNGLTAKRKEIPPATPEKSEETQGTKIRISTKTVGRNVFLNGSARGKTPLTISSLVPGYYTLSLDEPHSESNSWTIEVQNNQFDSYYFE